MNKGEKTLLKTIRKAQQIYVNWTILNMVFWFFASIQFRAGIAVSSFIEITTRKPNLFSKFELTFFGIF